MTLAVTTARKIIGDIGTVGFANIVNFDGFDSQDVSTIPAGPEGMVANRWNANFTPAQGQATVQVDDCGLVANPCALPAANPNLRRVTVNVSLAALQQNVQLTTFIANIGN